MFFKAGTTGVVIEICAKFPRVDLGPRSMAYRTGNTLLAKAMCDHLFISYHMPPIPLASPFLPRACAAVKHPHVNLYVLYP